MRDTVHEFTSLDGRLWATIGTLLMQPRAALFIVMEVLIAVYHDVLFYATLASL
jgi:hypothetical protein